MGQGRTQSSASRQYAPTTLELNENRKPHEALPSRESIQ
jgi:hypothetical protein